MSELRTLRRRRKVGLMTVDTMLVTAADLARLWGCSPYEAVGRISALGVRPTRLANVTSPYPGRHRSYYDLEKVV